MLLLLPALALSAPVTDLCKQEALDAAAAHENARWAALDMLDMSRVTHQLSEKAELVYEGVTLKKGDRVSARAGAGTIKPEETGHRAEVRIAGQQGTIVCFTRSTHGPTIRNELAVVRWDAQKWSDEQAAKMVSLPVFESTIHPSYLTVLPVKPK